ncbi:hypothetical protein NHH03_05115 [Stieleria sp. TO1_6]|uniref:beta-ketoacyl synthase N-terminal-like domain-containing protein n=1 Tax=Stieleria tagensis TaxID=2956795 RepID=UPI00209BB6C1|nr:beta-ketoacyl synthase N-terminal-like domain-containing protein [Stieleria tagensis]MCO8121109.1 hypothetical protein [Stieleria tagensis]
MNQNRLVIVAAEMSSSVGLSVAEVSASTLARVMRVTEIEYCDYYHTGFRVGVVPQEHLPQLCPALHQVAISDRDRRMIRLAAGPLQRLIAKVPASAAPPAVYLGLPEHQTTLPINPQRLIDQIYVQAELDQSAATAKALPYGRAAGLMGIQQAAADLSSGQSEFAVVGGVDSFIDLYLLGVLEMQKRIRTDRNADGFAPGEGAGFVLMTRSETASQWGLPVLATIEGCGAGSEPGHFYSEKPYLGDGLTDAFRNCLSATDESRLVDCVYASFNGERYWAKEFSVAMLRHKKRFDDNCQMEHPAECCGDMGAAGGAIMIGLAAHRMSRQRSSADTLVYGSSDYGQRAAVVLSSVSPGEN